MEMREVVYFKGECGCAYLYGYAWIDELDDDEPLNFTNQEGFDIGRLKIYGNVELTEDGKFTNEEKVRVEQDCAKLEQAFCEDSMLTEILFEYKDGINRVIPRDGYTLIINEQ